MVFLRIRWLIRMRPQRTRPILNTSIGAIIRPVGGWLSDKLGGALVTQICSVIMVAGALGAAHYMQAAYASSTGSLFPAFLYDDHGIVSGRRYW